MLNNLVVKSRAVLGACFAALSVVCGLASCGGGLSNDSNITINAYATPSLVAYGGTAVISWTSSGSSSCSASPTGKIATGSGTGKDGSFTTVALTTNTTFTITCKSDSGSNSAPITVSVGTTSIIKAAQCTPFSPLSGNTYYYCDCGTGSAAGCQNGDDNLYTGTDPLYPRRTIENAMTRFSSMAVNDTVALCQGGAFNATAGLSIGTNRCAAGTACNDLRDYTPAWLTAPVKPKPIINSAAGSADLFTIAYAEGGVRFLNLSLKGNNTNRGLFIYNAAHDLTVCNTDLDAFWIAIESAAGSLGNPKNITITGSSITNSFDIGFLGGGDNVQISSNNFEGNGSDVPLHHAIYMGGASPNNASVIGNTVHGQHGSTCNDGPFISHGSFDSLLVKDNIISIDQSAATAACWGFSYGNNTSNAHPVYFRKAVFSGNTVINGGNQGMGISSCPSCVIENNIIIMDWPGGSTGLSVTNFPHTYQSGRADDVSDANVIRNNTIWFGPSVTTTTTGIATNTEGTGHIISNNTVSSTQTSGTLNCFKHDLPLTSYAFINNNHCYATGSYNFEYTYKTWAAWKTRVNSNPSSNGFDSASVTGSSSADPLFTTPGTDFKPLGGSPLIGAGSGNTAYRSAADIKGALRPVLPALPAIGAYEP